jgi:hypothetical protein
MQKTEFVVFDLCGQCFLQTALSFDILVFWDVMQCRLAVARARISFTLQRKFEIMGVHSNIWTHIFLKVGKIHFSRLLLQVQGSE